MPALTLPWLSRFSLAVISLQSLTGLARAEVPVEQALGLYAATHPQHRELSPLWGMLALKSGILANIRFYGHYSSIPKAGLERNKHLEAKDNCPQDAISAVVQVLFPSPDGRVLTPNTYSGDPIGLIARETAKNVPPAHGGLKKILALLDATTVYRHQLERARAMAAGGEDKGGTTVPLERAAEQFQHAAWRILDRAGNPSGKVDNREFDPLRRRYAHLLQQAVLQESTDAARRYPPHVVEVALLAYAWRIADRVEQLTAAFSGHLLTGALETKARFDATYYADHQEQIWGRLDHMAAGQGTPETAISPEQMILFLLGAETFGTDGPTCRPVGQGHPSYKGSGYPDCGETSLRNFLNIVFSKQGELDPERVKALVAETGALAAGTGAAGESKAEAKAAPGQAGARMEAFYLHQQPRLADHNSAQAGQDWSDVVSALNTPGDPIPIRYSLRTAGTPTHELEACGVGNMLNLIAHLLPDPELRAPWPASAAERLAMAAGKLNRLCTLVSTRDQVFAWYVPDHKGLPDEFADVTFTINQRTAFVWSFMRGHFLLLPPPGNRADQLAARVAKVCWDPWLELWTRRSNPDLLYGEEPDTGPLPIRRPYEVYGFHLAPDLDFYRVLRGILAAPSDALAPTFQILVSRTLPRDLFGLEQLGEILYDLGEQKPDQRLYPMSGLLQWPQAERDRLLVEAVELDPLPAVEATLLLVDHGANVNQSTAAHGPLLGTAAANETPRVVRRMLAHGARVDARDADGQTPLMKAIAAGRLATAQVLAEAGADLQARDDQGLSVRQRAERGGRAGILAWLRQALAARDGAESMAGGGAESKADGSTH